MALMILKLVTQQLPLAVQTLLFLFAGMADYGKRIYRVHQPEMKYYAQPNELDGPFGKTGVVITAAGLVETGMRCFKLLGERVMTRHFDSQATELQVRTALLNRFTQLDTPTTVAIS
jgi:hypothetical protein